MALCALTQSVGLGCRETAGGIKAVYIIEKDSLLASGITSSAGTITAISTVANRKFFTYATEIETGNFKSTLTTSDANHSIYYVQDLTLKIFKPSISVVSEIDLLGRNRLIAIVLDNAGVYTLLGELNGLKLQPSAFDVGTALGDAYAYSLVFKGSEPSFAKQISASIMPALLA